MYTISIHAPPRGATNKRKGVIHLPRQFQFTPLREGRRENCGNQAARLQFQFTPLREGRHCVSPFLTQPAYFNSRPSARGDDGGVARRNRRVISIHAPPRGATLSACGNRYLSKFQFTPLREGRRHPRILERFPRPISIHAPPRGATFLLSLVRPSSTISIHAPPRGATRQTSDKPPTIDKFQFTPLREGRRAYCLPLPVRMLFQFTPLREGRRPNWGMSISGGTFQFTPLREGRLFQMLCKSTTPQNFNSRPSARGDLLPCKARLRLPCISIHAPPRGATKLNPIA